MYVSGQEKKIIKPQLCYIKMVFKRVKKTWTLKLDRTANTLCATVAFPLMRLHFSYICNSY